MGKHDRIIYEPTYDLEGHLIEGQDRVTVIRETVEEMSVRLREERQDKRINRLEAQVAALQETVDKLENRLAKHLHTGA